MVCPLIKSVSTLLGLSTESTDLKFMRNMLSKKKNLFDRADEKLEEIARKIDWNRAMRANECNRRQVQAFILGLTKLAIVGAEIEIAYYSEKLPTYISMIIPQINTMRVAMKK
ncbi:uncharacterized protein LOC134263161 [Saccostrea cucullata]|uniref:uncharacterized protein LOC134263161 n=1 Tax=Saccostrea cuccullata TaxID=36930 RepID=UPI002ED088CC